MARLRLGWGDNHNMIEYRVDIADAHAHRFRVTLTIRQPQFPVTVSLPVWIPGSYMVREFARHLQGLQAHAASHPLPVRVLDKATWQIDEGQARVRGALTLTYEVYGFDPSVRASYLDADRAFFNGTSLFLRVHGREQEQHQVSLGALPRAWHVATAMPKLGPKRFAAANYDEAVDHPFELGSFWRGAFVARGVTHEFVVSNPWPDFDGDRLLRDTQTICEKQIDFWHGKQGGRAGKRAAPFAHYLFILHAVEDGYGGLEHRASTALIASRRDLPRRNAATATSDGYVTLLGLISHEYFHTWNVKRLKPVPLQNLDYTRENFTGLLWFFEGFTSYYDDLMLRRCGLIGDEMYLKLIAKQINAVMQTPGRHVQSVAQASFDAWIKYYRADENTPNTTISYYAKGALVALALDLSLRTQGSGTLDDVMRLLWRTRARGDGAVDEAAIAAALREVAGRSMAKALKAWVHGTEDGPWLTLLERMGVAVKHDAMPSMAAALGLRVSEGPLSGIHIKSVMNGSVAERAGLAVGDEILAFDGWRLRKLDDALALGRPGSAFELTVSREQRLRMVHVDPARHGPTQVVLAPAPRPDAQTLLRRQRWLLDT